MMELGFGAKAVPLQYPSPVTCLGMSFINRERIPSLYYPSRPLPWSPNPYTQFLNRNLYLDICRNLKCNMLPHEPALPVVPFMFNGVFQPPSSSQSSPIETAQTFELFSPSLCCPSAQDLVISYPECHRLPTLFSLPSHSLHSSLSPTLLPKVASPKSIIIL